MLLLNSITSLLQLATSAAGSVSVQVSYVDAAGAVITTGPATNGAVIITAATTTIVASPAASTSRNVKDISIRNTHASIGNVVTLIHTDGTTAIEKYKCSLAAGETLVYDQIGDFQFYDVNGVLKTISTSAGGMLRQTVLTSGTSVILSAATTKVRTRVRAGGGGGGGVTLVAVAAGCAGGGAQGGYAEKYLQGVLPGATITYAIGAAGAAGSTAGGNGGTGGNSTIILNGVTTTANGGLGGVGMVSVTTAAFTLGGASPAVSTNADYAGGGEPGFAGIQVSGTQGVSGRGGGEGAGNARNTAGAGNAALANSGGGGGGAVSLNGSAAAAGGAGGTGFIILEEFA